MKKSTWVFLISLFIIGVNTSVFSADSKLSTEERLNRLERLVNSKGLVDIMVRVESIQSELQSLLGEIEVQKHSLDEIKKRQRDLYIDLDRRILQLERGSSSNGSVSTNAFSTAPKITKKNTKKVVVATTPTTQPIRVPVIKKKKEGEQIAYQKAFDLLRALRYEKASQTFRQFLNDFPNGRYAHIAQYWLAETSYHTRKYDIAIQDYETLIQLYPSSPKRADALLKISYSQFELKLFSKSKKVLQQLIQSYPGTTEAGQAKKLLKKIRLRKSQ